jgi:hypothetical protein
MRIGLALAALIGIAAAPAGAGTVEISGTRSNISPGGTPGGRCAPALTITFGPAAFTAGGTSTLGDFNVRREPLHRRPAAGRLLQRSVRVDAADRHVVRYAHR